MEPYDHDVDENYAGDDEPTDQRAKIPCTFLKPLFRYFERTISKFIGDA